MQISSSLTNQPRVQRDMGARMKRPEREADSSPHPKIARGLNTSVEECKVLSRNVTYSKVHHSCC